MERVKDDKAVVGVNEGESYLSLLTRLCNDSAENSRLVLWYEDRFKTFTRRRNTI